MLLFKLLLMVILTRKGRTICRLLGAIQQPELAQDGDLIIGGIFSFRTGQDYFTDTFQSIPGFRKCKKYGQALF